MSLEEIKKLPIWITWKYEMKDGRETKIPYQTSGKRASSTDKSTWTTYEDALTDGRSGIIFEPEHGIIGVDFDHCVAGRKITNEQVKEFVNRAKTYCELSPSKTGLHLLFKSTERIDLQANKHRFNDTQSVEVYTWGRYFTFTGDAINDHDLMEIDAEMFTMLLEMLGYPWGKDKKTANDPSIDYIPTSFLSDEEILHKMFSARNGEKVRRLYDGNISDYHNDASSADFSLCSTLAFWSNKDYQVIERLWLASPLGKREKTQQRQDYRNRTIINALDATHEVYKPKLTEKVGLVSAAGDYDFIMGGKENDQPQLIAANIIRILRNNELFINKFRRNTFSHMVETTYDSNNWEMLTDNIIMQVRNYVVENFKPFSRLSLQMTQEAILAVADDTRVNPPKDYITGVTWDGVPRLNSWLHHAYGVPDDELHQAIGSNWLKGLVKRVIMPGCQFDEVLALESKQGWRKSTSIRVLGAPWHVETTHSTDNKDFYLLLAQNVIVEFSEGEIFDRTSVKKIKAEITKTEDQLRPPYERGMVTFKRSCVFAITTNELELKDTTGNRRWLPVKLEKCADIDWIAENRDQLYAEAYHRVIINKETTHEYPDELRTVQEDHSDWSENDEKIADWLSTIPKSILEEGVSSHDAIRAVRGQDHRIDRIDELRIASVMRVTFKMKSGTKRSGNKVKRRWFPTPDTYEVINVEEDYNF
jgi:predicted P-loop ATPase